MNAGIAVAITDEEIPVRRNREVGREVEWRAGVLHRPEVHARRAGVRWLAGRPQRRQRPAVGRELADDVALIVGAIDGIVRANGDAVRPGEETFTPHGEHIAVAIEDDDGMFAAIEDEDAI